ncbi:hypothetical protein AB0L57_04800 [Nocardia sp. NPDC052254]|uniref:hypothetical protein n=1 Tax=Nocardia sp. NPDC052254 TaxID=3155681 RepID=UPI003439A37E
MAGDQEPPVRYRGEPPRYSERVVDPENPIPAGRRGRIPEDEWGAEAYAPGLPGSERGGAPADWDDVPLRPIRRRTRHEDLGRTRREADPASESGSRRRRSRGDRRDADAIEQSRDVRGESARRRALPELEVGDTRNSGRTAAEVNAAQRSSNAGRSTEDRGIRVDSEPRQGQARTARESRDRTAAPPDSARDNTSGRKQSARDRRSAQVDTGEGARRDGDAGGERRYSGSSGANAAESAASANRESDIDLRDSAATSESGNGGAPATTTRERGAAADAAGTATSRTEFAGTEVPEYSGTPAAAEDGARAGAPARDRRREVSGEYTGNTERAGTPSADDVARTEDRPESHNSAAAQNIPDSGRERRRADGAGDRPADRESSYANGTTQQSDLPAGFDQPHVRTRRGRDVNGNQERGSRRETGYDNGSGRRGDGATRRGRTDRGLRDRNGSKLASYEQLSGGTAAPGPDRRSRPAKKKNQGPALLDDAARARLEAVAREGAGLRAAWAMFRIRTDDLRRVNAAARIESVVEDGFDRGTAQLTDRGYIGAGGGRMNVVGRPVEYRATTAQVAGLWPWSVGAGAPLIGTPLGSHLHTGAPVCFDPMNWFMRGSFITAPSLFVLGLNGFGKSSLVRRIVLGGVAQGITPLILADVKPDYRKMVEMVGGQVIDLGYGHGKLNPLAGGVLGSIVPQLADQPDLQLQVTQELRARQVTLIAGLVELVRGARVRDYEETLVSTALRILYREGSGFAPESPPIMEDLLEVVIAGGQELMLDAGADNTDEYHEATKGLRRSLRALTQGPFGAVFNGQTTTPIDTSAVAVCIDVSHIPSGDKKLKAAVMLACWADGFASVEAAHVLADGKLGPQRYFQVVMDELWQVLGLGDFMVDRVDELTRLQRGMATSLIMISHTIKDLQSLGSEAAIAKALGFLERARAKIFGALPPEEISRLDSTIPFTSAEEEMVTSWSAPQALTGEALKPGQARPPAPGTGKFLLKIGEDRRPGIPFHMEFTASEKESGIHETNQRFSEFTESTARRGDEGSAA